MVYYVCKYFLSRVKSFVDNEIIMKNIHTISIGCDPFNYKKKIIALIGCCMKNRIN